MHESLIVVDRDLPCDIDVPNANLKLLRMGYVYGCLGKSCTLRSKLPLVFFWGFNVHESLIVVDGDLLCVDVYTLVLN